MNMKKETKKHLAATVLGLCGIVVLGTGVNDFGLIDTLKGLAVFAIIGAVSWSIIVLLD